MGWKKKAILCAILHVPLEEKMSRALLSNEWEKPAAAGSGLA